jgi:hypothetical protein
MNQYILPWLDRKVPHRIPIKIAIATPTIRNIQSTQEVFSFLLSFLPSSLLEVHKFSYSMYLQPDIYFNPCPYQILCLGCENLGFLAWNFELTNNN